jgi:hypothetical protein
MHADNATVSHGEPGDRGWPVKIGFSADVEVGRQDHERIP